MNNAANVASTAPYIGTPAAEGTTPPWMSTSTSESVWRFKRYPDLGNLSFSLHQPLGKGFYLDDQSHTSWLKCLILVACYVGAKRGYTERDGQTMYYFCRRFVDYMRWLVSSGLDIRDISASVAEQYMRYCSFAKDAASDSSPASILEPAGTATDIEAEASLEADDEDADLEDDEASESEEELLSKALESPPDQAAHFSATHLLGLVSPIIQTWEARNLLPFELTEAPFPQGAYALAKQYGVKRQSTPLVPLRVGAEMLRGALFWIEELGPLVLKAVNARSSKSKKRWIRSIECKARQRFMTIHIEEKKFKRIAHVFFIPFRTIVEVIIPHAFFVTISCLTLARPGEVSGLEVDCIFGTEENGQWMGRYIEKNYRQSRSAPVHPSIARGIRLLENLYAARRKISGTNILLCKQSVHERSKTFNGKDLDTLAQIIGVAGYTDSHGVERNWHFTPRQFRQFAAALWAYRFELPVAALSVAMFHFDFVRTSMYLNNKDFNAWHEHYSRRLTAEIVEATAAGSKAFAGTQSGRYRRMEHRLRVNMRVTAERAEKLVAKAVTQDANVIASPNAWGFCLCMAGENKLRHARCLQEDIGVVGPDGRPDSESSSPGTCCGCRYFMSHRSRLPYLNDSLKRTIAIVVHPKTPAKERELAKARQLNLETVIADLEAEFAC